MRSTAILGFGCAGYYAAKAIRDHDKNIQIDVYSNTSEAPYNPMLTTYYVSGKISEQEMFPFGTLDEIRAELDLNIFCDTPVKKLHARALEVELAGGERRRYDDIVIATGARAVLPPIKGLPDRGVFTMRTADDARRLNAALEGGVRSAVVVGGQMVGIKVVELLRKRGVHVILADMAERLFPLSAFPNISDVLERRLAEQGVELRFGTAVSGVCEEGGQMTVRYANGGEERCDIVVFCSGIRSNISFVDPTEIELGVTVKTDLHMRTSAPHVYAAGDCCETLGILNGQSTYIGLWANSTLEGTVAGENIVGLDTAYPGNLIHNITHYMDTDFISFGDVFAEGKHISWESRDQSWRLEATVKDGRILAMNIVDNAHVSGPAKQILLRRYTDPDEPMTEVSRLTLLDSGLDETVLAELGG